MHDSEPQGCVQQLKSLKPTPTATNGNKHKNEASKPTFAHNLFKLSCKYTQSEFSNQMISFNALNSQHYDKVLKILSQVMKLSID